MFDEDCAGTLVEDELGYVEGGGKDVEEVVEAWVTVADILGGWLVAVSELTGKVVIKVAAANSKRDVFKQSQPLSP